MSTTWKAAQEYSRKLKLDKPSRHAVSFDSLNGFVWCTTSYEVRKQRKYDLFTLRIFSTEFWLHKALALGYRQSCYTKLVWVVFFPSLDDENKDIRNGHVKRLSCLENKTNPLNAQLNPICHLLALLGAHPILHVSRIRVKHSGWKSGG
jgi:hypothetical protein